MEIYTNKNNQVSGPFTFAELRKIKAADINHLHCQNLWPDWMSYNNAITKKKKKHSFLGLAALMQLICIIMLIIFYPIWPVWIVLFILAGLYGTYFCNSCKNQVDKKSDFCPVCKKIFK